MSELRSERGATVEFRNLRMRFGTVTAVEDFSLTVGTGEFLTLLGPSGSGKTTALNVVAGFLTPTAGDILIDGRSIATLPTERRNVGMVFQNYSLFPHMTVFENVAFPLKMRHEQRDKIKERVQHALSLVHLSDYGARMPSQLSGGQQQRVAFARAIVFQPKVLLMDEPLGALDLKLREHMQLEIKHYQEQIGCTVIYVTHDQNEALTLSDRIVVMNEGQIVQIGTPENIYDLPRTRFAAEFIGETNILTLSASRTADRDTLYIEAIGHHFTTRPGDSDNPESPTYLSVRPEKISRLSADNNSTEGLIQFDALIEEIVFLGDVIRYLARVSEGPTLIFKEHRTGSSGTLRVGDSVRLGFMQQDAVLLHGCSQNYRSYR